MVPRLGHAFKKSNLRIYFVRMVAIGNMYVRLIFGVIRESVDALCRGGVDHVSRDHCWLSLKITLQPFTDPFYGLIK